MWKVNGQRFHGEDAILEVATQHFEGFMGSYRAEGDLFAIGLEGHVVSEEENDGLLKQFNREEVCNAIKSLDKECSWLRWVP